MLPACGARGGEGSSGRRMGGREEETEGEERVGKVWIGSLHRNVAVSKHGF